MRALLFAVMVCGLVACGRLEEHHSIEYEFRHFKVESSPGCNSDTTSCATFEVEYPEFEELDTAIQRVITDRICYWLGGGAEEVLKPMAVLGNDFIEDFRQFSRDIPDFGLGWYSNTRVGVLVASDSLISLQVDTDSFTGGAHGSFTTTFINIDPKTGTDYLLGALLRPGYEEVLNRLGEEDFRKQRSLAEGDSLEDAGFNFESGQFRLNDNYGFSKEGIVFFFNSYEIAAYAEGPTEILVPYERLREWMQ